MNQVSCQGCPLLVATIQKLGAKDFSLPGVDIETNCTKKRCQDRNSQPVQSCRLLIFQIFWERTALQQGSFNLGISVISQQCQNQAVLCSELTVQSSVLHEKLIIAYFLKISFFLESRGSVPWCHMFTASLYHDPDKSSPHSISEDPHNCYILIYVQASFP